MRIVKVYKPSLHIVITVILSLVFAAVIFFSLSLKENLFMDEILSYFRANRPAMPDNRGVLPYNVMLTDLKTVLSDYLLTVSEPFNFRNVYIQETMNVHPPLYYYLLHFICSLFPGTFSIYYAGAINVLFGILTLILLGRIVRIFTNDPLTYTLSLTAYILSHAIICQVIFLRMYIMLGFWITALVYLFIHDPLQEKDIRYYIFLFITVYGGISTHYHFLLFLAPASLIYLIVLLKHRKYRIILWHTVTVCAAFLCAYLSFPYMLHQLTQTDRAAEAVHNLRASRIHTEYFHELASLLFANLFGPHYLLFILLAVTGCAVCLFQKEHRLQFLLTVLPLCIFYLLTTETISFMSVRYYFALYPVLIILFFLFIRALFTAVPRMNRIAPVLTFLILTLGNACAYRTVPMEYMFYGDSEKRQILAPYTDADCLFIMHRKDMQAPVYADIAELSEYNSLTLAAKDDLSQAAALLQDSQKLIVVTDDGYFYTSDTLLEEIQELLSKYGLPDQMTDLGSFTEFTHTYYCMRK